MGQIERWQEIIRTYQRHGWQLRRALLTPLTRTEIAGHEAELFGDLRRQDSTVDALWFARPSPRNREAWELRLVAENQYALFEAFGPDESEAQREAVRCAMEARMSERVNAEKSTNPVSDSADPTSPES